MLITGHPQFETQTDAGFGHGIPPIPEWQLDFPASHDHHPLPNFSSLAGVDHQVANVFLRLQNVFQRAHKTPLSPTQLHDLTCFVIHRLLLSSSSSNDPRPPLTSCVRDATVLYMFIIQGPTYFSHAVIFNQVLDRFARNFEQLQHQHTRSASLLIHHTLQVWFVAVGMVACVGTPRYRWFAEQAASSINKVASGWADVLGLLRSVLWLETPQAEAVFRPHWDAVLDGGGGRLAEPPDELLRKGAAGFI